MRKLVFATSSIIFFAVFSSASSQDHGCGSVAECAQKAMASAKEMADKLEFLIPRGSIMAFNLEKCPDGWESFSQLAGRVPVGAGFGNRDQNDGKLKPRRLGESGGEVQHRLTISEMPKHSHSHTFSTGRDSPAHTDNTADEFGKKDTMVQTTSEGGSAPHNNMPPYFVVTYCVRQ